MQRITIDVKPRPYDAIIAPGLLKHAGERLAELLPGRTSWTVVSAAPIQKAWGAVLQRSLKEAGLKHEVLLIDDGERHKTLDTVKELAQKMAKLGSERSSAVVGFGGGVVCDTAGFLASIYMRGIDCAHIPTTLLAQVDAAIGGKTGVNLKSGKNLLGTFHQPRAVLIDPAVLATLPEREFRSGVFESLKCGVIANAAIFEFMEQNRDKILSRDGDALQWLIAESVRVKAKVVAGDERESGQRAILNFGHTIGHALEAETGYRHFLHGEAVAWGMVAAAMIGAAMQKTDAETARRIISAVLSFSPLPRVESRGKAIAKRLLADKKTVRGVPHFILPVALGRVEIVSDVAERTVVQAVEELRYLSRS